MQIGFIGLGNLGLPVAENILQKRQQLLVYNRTASKAQSIIQNGAVLSKSVRELASACDIVFSIVSDDAALNHITKGENGIAENLKAGGIHISMSTILPATATSLTEIHKQHSNYYISSPIMGRPEMARARKLIFLVSGDTLHIEKIKPLLDDAGAASIREFGEETADACVAKLCTNFLIVSAIESLAESINLARKSNIDVNAWINMITHTLFASPIYTNYSNILLKESFQPAGFALKLGLKDINLVVEQSQDAKAEMPLSQLLQQRLHESVAKGYGDHDLTGIALLLK